MCWMQGAHAGTSEVKMAGCGDPNASMHIRCVAAAVAATSATGPNGIASGFMEEERNVEQPERGPLFRGDRDARARCSRRRSGGASRAGVAEARAVAEGADLSARSRRCCGWSIISACRGTSRPGFSWRSCDLTTRTPTFSPGKQLGLPVDIGRFGLPECELGQRKVKLAERPLAVPRSSSCDGGQMDGSKHGTDAQIQRSMVGAQGIEPWTSPV